MTVTAPPRPPRRSSDPVERDEFEALVEALIEEARQRARRRRRMYLAVAAFVTLGAAGVFALLDRTAEAQTTDSSALAAPSSLSAAPKQRVEITAGGPWGPTSPGRWVLAPGGSGELEPDSGTETSVVRNERHVVRQGQDVKILTWVATAEGKHGSFVLRERIEHMEAGNGFGIGTGTWTLVRGTGAYADATGGGRVSQAESERSRRWSEAPLRVPHDSVVMTVTAPPRPPRPSDPVTHGEFDALVEALIEEARQRAQRRRRRNGAVRDPRRARRSRALRGARTQRAVPDGVPGALRSVEPCRRHDELEDRLHQRASRRRVLRRRLRDERRRQRAAQAGQWRCPWVRAGGGPSLVARRAEDRHRRQHQQHPRHLRHERRRQRAAKADAHH